MGAHRAVGEQLVMAASPKFKDFRVDFEKISNAASKAAREGRDGLTPGEAFDLFNDGDWDLRIPLQRRYVEQGAFEAVAHYHAKRFKLLLGRNTPWPDEPGQDALRLFAEHGRADVGVALVRSYVEMQHKRLKQDYSTRNPRGSRKPRPEGVENAIATINKVIANAIPDRKAELLKDIESVAPYVEQHGNEDDRAWMDDVCRQIWMERRA